MIGLRDERPPQAGVSLLETVMRGGRRTAERPALTTGAERLLADLAWLPPETRRIRAPVAPRAVTSERLAALAEEVRHRIDESAPAPRPPGPQRSVST
ncbi:hypothetical protein OG440_02440 [Streptomyces sp. NBC_00637]|uniref:hypothetical protein n=1 Tax=Streptomyces sp. NBC_00637 TaxID=2903667 RepID=UPI003250FB6C